MTHLSEWPLTANISELCSSRADLFTTGVPVSWLDSVVSDSPSLGTECQTIVTSDGRQHSIVSKHSLWFQNWFGDINPHSVWTNVIQALARDLNPHSIWHEVTVWELLTGLGAWCCLCTECTLCHGFLVRPSLVSDFLEYSGSTCQANWRACGIPLCIVPQEMQEVLMTLPNWQNRHPSGLASLANFLATQCLSAYEVLPFWSDDIEQTGSDSSNSWLALFSVFWEQ